MNEYIKTLIEANKDAVSNIAVLEATVREYPVVEEGSLMGRILRKKVLMENKA